MRIAVLSTILLLLTAPAGISAQQAFEQTIVPNRFIVIYREGRMLPASADTGVPGLRVVERQERLGMVTVAVAASGSSTAKPRATLSDAAMMQQLAADPAVEYVLHDRIVMGHHLHVRRPDRSEVFSVAIGSATFDTYYNSPQGWAVREAGGYGKGVPGGPVSGPWNTTTGTGVRVAILDSGVDSTHPDIAPNLALNLSEVDQSALPSNCDDGSPQDQTGHGTWTASLAAGAMGLGTGRVIGVAPSAAILNIKVLERTPANITGANDTARCVAGESAGLLSWVLSGINDALANHADVISMSLGTTVDLASGDGSGAKATFDRVTYAATQAGVVLVAAAGNDGYNLSNPRYVELPAQARGVLAVVASTNPDCSENRTSGATCHAGPVSLSYYSNYGAPLNAIAAPGGSDPEGDEMGTSGWIRGACSSGLPASQDGMPGDGAHSFGCFGVGHTAYVQAIGTSASAPLVAGAVALIKGAHPDWDAATILDALRNTAYPSTGTLPAPQLNLPAALLYR